jgi:hypothetical protein
VGAQIVDFFLQHCQQKAVRTRGRVRAVISKSDITWEEIVHPEEGEAKRAEVPEEVEGGGSSQVYKNNRTSSGSGKNPEYKFFPHGYGKEKSTLSYEVVKDLIIQFIQSTY